MLKTLMLVAMFSESERMNVAMCLDSGDSHIYSHIAWRIDEAVNE